LLAVASGCSRSPQEKIVLYPVVDERGITSYVTTDPGLALAEKDQRIAQEQRRKSDEADRLLQRERGLQEVTRYRQAQQDKIEQRIREWQEELANPSPIRSSDIIATHRRNLGLQQQQWREEHASRPDDGQLERDRIVKSFDEAQARLQQTLTEYARRSR
jgi:hypothetical protein